MEYISSLFKWPIFMSTIHVGYKHYKWVSLGGKKNSFHPSPEKQRMSSNWEAWN